MILTLQKISGKQKYFISILGLLLLIIPKINVISLSSYEGAGLRVDDFILLLLLAIFFLSNIWKGWTINKTEALFLVFLLSGIISIFANIYYERGNVLYVIRLLEYWTFFYIGAFIGLGKRLQRFLLVLLTLNGLVIFLQYFGAVGGYANGIYQSSLTRPSGLTNGAYEVPMVIALIFAFMLSHYSKVTFKVTLLYIISNVLIILTAARIPFVAVNAIFFYYYIKNNRLSLRSYVAIGFLAISISFFIAYSSNSIRVNEEHSQSFTERISEIFNVETINAVSILILMAPEEANGVSGSVMRKTQVSLKTGNIKSQFNENSELEADLSLMVRVNKWLWAIKTYLNQDVGYFLFGLGPGALGNALDGGILRILLENGLIGFICFIIFIFYRPKISGYDPMLLVAFTFLLGNLFIDYYLSYKVMALYFLLLGAAVQSLHIKKKWVSRGQ